MSVVATTPVTAADIELELALDLELTLCIESATRAEAAAHFERAQDLHKQRKPHMVEAFERARGLRK